MASKRQSNSKISKTVLDLNDCIIEMKNDFKEGLIPINDDNTLLHKFCIKLEYLLQFDIKEKTTLLGKRKNYWDYFYKCLTLGKNIHDGITYVKRLSEIHTSDGRGRAFIRFCLMHQCLADTIQQCIQSEKITNEWYGSKSPLIDSYQANFLISSLYELNDCTFDLTPYGVDLDIAWPTFARKMFSSPYSWKIPSRHASISSLTNSLSSQNEPLPALDQQSIESDVFSNERKRTNSFHSEIEDLQGVIDKYQEENNLLKSKNNELKQIFSQKEQNLRKQIESLENELSQLRDSSNSKSEMADQTVQTTDTSCLDKSNEPTSSSTNNNFIEQGYQQSLKSLCEKFNSVDKGSKSLEIKLRENNDRILDCDIESFLRNIADVKASLSNFSTIQDKIISNINSLTMENCRLKNEKPTIDTENEQLKEEINMLRSEVNKLRAYKAYPQLEEKANALKDALATAKKIIGLKDMKLERLQSEVQKYKPNSSSDSPSKVTNTTLSPSVKLDEIWPPPSDPNSTNFLLYEQVNVLFTHLEKTEKEKGMLTNIIKLAIEIQTNLETKLSEKNGQLDESEKQIKILNEKLMKMLTLVDSQQNHTKAIKDKLDRSLEENKKLTQQMIALNELLQQVEKTEASTKASVPVIEKEENVPEEMLTCAEKVPDSKEIEPCAATVASDSSLKEAPVIVAKVNRTLSKLHSLIEEKMELQQELETSKEIASNLLTKVAEQEQQLSTVTMELSHTKELVAKLRSAFSSVQTNESILRYEVREKRHLLNKLKSQLESSRAQVKHVRQKNSESQIEWQNLREEFAQRHKQGSEESGFSDEASKTESKVSAQFVLAENDSHQSEIFNEVLATPDEVSSPISEEFPSEDDESDPRDRRLRFLEEQCRLLCGKLLKSAKYGAALDMRLTSLHDQYGSGEADDQNITSPEEQESIGQESGGDENNENVQNSSLESPEINIGENEVSDIVDIGSPEDVPYSAVQIPTEIEEKHNPEKPSPFILAQALPKRIEKLRKEKEELQKQLQRINDCYQLSEAREVHLNAQIQLFQMEKEELLKKLQDAQGQLLEYSTSEKKSSNIDNKRYEEMISLKDKLQSKLESIQKKLEERTSTMNEMEEKLRQSAEEMVLVKKSFDQQISALQFQFNTEALEHQQNLKTCRDQSANLKTMQIHINEQEMAMKNLENQLQDVNKEYELERETQWQKLEELKTLLANKTNDCSKLTENLKQVSEDFENEKKLTSDLKQEKENLMVANQDIIKSLQEEIEHLQIDNEELKKRIVQLLKDKDILWKQNERLSFWKKLQTADRRLLDENIVRCEECKTEFSDIMNKHLCKICRGAFCPCCSNNWIEKVGSKKKKRVCNDCYCESQKDRDVNAYINYSFHKEDDEALLESTRTSSMHKPSLSNSSMEGRMSPTSSIEDFFMVNNDATENPGSSQTIDINKSTSVPYSDVVLFHCCMDEILDGGSKVTMTIQPGKKHGVPISISKMGFNIYWKFSSESKDIAFFVLHSESLEDIDMTAEVIIPFEKYKAHVNIIEGQLIPKKKGIYLLVFDNSYSRFTSKKITLDVQLVEAATMKSE